MLLYVKLLACTELPPSTARSNTLLSPLMMVLDDAPLSVAVFILPLSIQNNLLFRGSMAMGTKVDVKESKVLTLLPSRLQVLMPPLCPKYTFPAPWSMRTPHEVVNPLTSTAGLVPFAFAHFRFELWSVK